MYSIVATKMLWTSAKLRALSDVLNCDLEEWQKHVTQVFFSLRHIIDNEKENEKQL